MTTATTIEQLKLHHRVIEAYARHERHPIAPKARAVIEAYHLHVTAPGDPGAIGLMAATYEDFERARAAYDEAIAIRAIAPHLERVLAWTHEPQDERAMFGNFGPSLSSELLPGWHVSLLVGICGQYAGKGGFCFRKETSCLNPDTAAIENPITPHELDAILDVVGFSAPRLGYWNDPPREAVSVAIAYIYGDALRQMLTTYHKGCPDHPEKTVFCGCATWREQYGLVRYPEGWRR